MMHAGAAVTVITPPPGCAMAGFAARADPALDAHDPLTARALVVGNTALATADVIGIDAAMSRRVRQRCALPAENVTIAATHTHGGPVSMPGRLWARADPAILRRIEDGLVAAIDRAAATRAPARLSGGTGAEPGFARNRRSPDGPVDTGVPILRFDDAAGRPIAILVSYACHPVVLGSDNRRWTGDYPHFVRAELKAAYPGAVVVFATGCAGDVNTGHSAAASLSNTAQAGRTFARARAIGQGIARSASTATAEDITGDIGAAEVRADLAFAQLETDTPDALAEMWSEQADRAEDGGAIHRIWADWARTIMGRNCAPAPARITALRWGGARIVALPGEIFAQTALEMRQSVQAPGPVFLLAYADDNPGYIPPRDAYAQGGYEVEEAHRFYGLAATMAPGTAERLAAAGCDAAEAARTAAHHNPTNEHATEGSTL